MTIGIDMLPDVQKLAAVERLWSEGDCVVVAVSGDRTLWLCCIS